MVLEQRDASWVQVMMYLHVLTFTSSTSCEFAIDVHETGEVFCLFSLRGVGSILWGIQHISCTNYLLIIKFISIFHLFKTYHSIIFNSIKNMKTIIWWISSSFPWTLRNRLGILSDTWIWVLFPAWGWFFLIFIRPSTKVHLFFRFVAN